MRPSDNPYTAPAQPEQRPCQPFVVFAYGMCAGMLVAIVTHVVLSPVKFAYLHQWFQ